MQIVAIISLAVCIVFLATFVVDLLKVLRDGVAGVERIDRAGFGAHAYWKGAVPRQSASSSVGTQEGILARGRDGKIALRQTRTISRELL